ncbi:unnamed protein product [Lymnaea stagnalis]|uniref:Bcl-2 Bcl-2 homology region 1-3 domain-containing protein n=1 Tax=Lymnaea stagnalis TaxID=6523 RepID=A0AAV2IPV2_LYMST
MAHSHEEIDQGSLPVPIGTVSRLVRMQAAANTIHPDTEANVVAQTEDVFLNYVYQSYQNDVMRGNTEDAPALPELVSFTTASITPAAEIGRQLARLGDDINEKYADIFDQMISDLNLGVDGETEPYEAFANIGRRVFSSGINWGRIMILLGFGYRIAITKLKTQITNFARFLASIVSFICRFVISERISKWIADHGGWRAALSYIPTVSSSMFWLVSGLAALSVLAVVSMHRYLH